MQIQKAVKLSLEEDGDWDDSDDPSSRDRPTSPRRDSPSPQIVSPDSSPVPQLLGDAADRDLELAIRLSQREFEESQRRRRLREEEMLERAIALSMRQQ